MTARAIFRPLATLVSALRARMKGPGGYYNSGNALGLVVGFSIQIATMPVGLREGSAVTSGAARPIGAIGLGIALLLLGDPLLAATSGLLHALGKFGSTFHKPGTRVPLWPATWPDPFRSAVLASRLPAMLATTVALGWALLEVWSGGSMELAMPLTLLGCYLLWTRADLLLFGVEAKALRQISTC